MDIKRWNKITNSSSTSHGSYIKSTNHRKYNIIHVITDCRDNNIAQTNIQENRSIFNQIIYIQAIGTKLISLPTKTPASDHIGDVVKSPLLYDWYDSIFANDEKISK